MPSSPRIPKTATTSGIDKSQGREAKAMLEPAIGPMMRPSVKCFEGGKDELASDETVLPRPTRESPATRDA